MVEILRNGDKDFASAYSGSPSLTHPTTHPTIKGRQIVSSVCCFRRYFIYGSRNQTIGTWLISFGALDIIQQIASSLKYW